MMKGRTPEIEQSVRNYDEKVAYVEEVLKEQSRNIKINYQETCKVGSGIVRYYKNKFQRIRIIQSCRGTRHG